MKLLFASLLLMGSVSQAGANQDASEWKEAIIQKAKESMGNRDPEIRQTLDSMVEKLLKRTRVDPEESANLKIGVWKQLWTDDADDTNSNGIFVKALPSETYQVVLSKELFYNISTVRIFPGIYKSAFLRAEVSKTTSGMSDFSFSNLYLANDRVTDESPLLEMTYDIEAGELAAWDISALTNEPGGPVKARGSIETIYIDQELRIDRGFNKKDSVVDLFILTRL